MRWLPALAILLAGCTTPAEPAADATAPPEAGRFEASSGTQAGSFHLAHAHDRLAIHASANLAEGRTLQLTINDEDARTMILKLGGRGAQASDVYLWPKAGTYTVSAVSSHGQARFALSWCTDEGAANVPACSVVGA